MISFIKLKNFMQNKKGLIEIESFVFKSVGHFVIYNKKIFIYIDKTNYKEIPCISRNFL